ncbi:MULTISPECIES: redox-active disulfide protein 2 [Flavobacterium]|uniref:Redox-active disulfide protein 2 n=1 Tax=Flavobacterium endoglycinae TaxID=2816357 RepID=A0ABX7QIY7_9FLAO|nr:MULTISPECIES: redox-active disulfide protein 2 [Flavobacterium]QSW90556.1 redox-active disulfide protein 2 [Flavobacterium endoglycinae]
MADKKKYSAMTNEELVKNHKTLKTLTYTFGVVLFFSLISNLFIVFIKGFSVANVVPIALLPILILNLKNLKEITKEIESRK